MEKERVLITGMSGLVGSAVRRQIEEKYELTALNRGRDVPGVKTHLADIHDFEAIRPAFDDQDYVVHLAASLGAGQTWDDYHRANILGTYNVFEAALQAGVKRVVYASSGNAIAGWEREEPYKAIVEGRYDEVPASFRKMTHETPSRPIGLYGVTKVFGEALARHLTDTTDLSIICLRFGHVVKEDRPLTTRDYSLWCSQRDVARMIECCIAAPESVKFNIFYAISDNKWSYRDLERPREVVGFKPLDNAEDYRS
ncbi:MAG: NAD(P)-dependent oxidoreductase [Spirochaetales bacterium]|nr:NAD(P)-dependent oxidoreductase [Spirochaetales bacterium]